MRRKEIKSLAFFRDLGGIKNSNGEIVKSGLLFRTSEIKELTPSDYKELLEDYHITTCIDFRTNDEVRISPDQLTNSVDYYHIPLLSNDQNPAVTKETRVDVLKMRMKEEGGMKGHVTRLYRLLVNNDDSLKGFRKAFDVIIKSEGGTVYHCTQGKDRTGMFSAFILGALGVDRETIINDYLRYNSYHRFKRFWIFVGMSIVFFIKLPFKYARELNYALVARRKFIEAAFEEIDNQYGNIENFLRKGIGLAEEDIFALRKKYLVAD